MAPPPPSLHTDLPASTSGGPDEHETKKSDTTNVTVLLTGFGTFGTVTDNESYRIATLLAKTFPTFDIERNGSKYHIKLVCYPKPIRVAYFTVRRLLPLLWSDTESTATDVNAIDLKFDIIIHIGRANALRTYTLESCAHSWGYKGRDVDGHQGPWPDEVRSAVHEFKQAPTDVDFDKVNNSTRSFLSAGDATQQPIGETEDPGDIDDDSETDLVLWTGIKTPMVALITQSAFQDRGVIVNPSIDAGRYLCEYIFFRSLKESILRQKRLGLKLDDGPKKVLFIHVPPEDEVATVATGALVVRKVIEEVVIEHYEKKHE